MSEIQSKSLDSKPQAKQESPLGVKPITGLVSSFAVPSIIAMLVGAIYNIVDQIFIGQYVGTLGNAATNIVFPLSISCVAIALLCGIGAASNFNLAMGRRQTSDAAFYIGNGITLTILLGILLCVVSELFMKPMLMLFGSTADVLPYAVDYVRVVAIGFPFLILTTAGGHVIRADGSPKFAMVSNMTGAVLNVGLDALFVAVMGMGMTGAALATIIGQIISGFMVIFYLKRYKTVELKLSHFVFKVKYLARILSLGAASSINQVAMMITQIALNNALKIYGAMSIYGAETPIACAGIALKVCQVFFAVIIGIVQGSQPIFGYNYGAKKYDRVKETYKVDIIAGAAISILAFLLFRLFPRQIISIFGNGNDLYFQFGERFLQIYYFGILFNFVQVISSTFFTSIGKPIKGIFLSLTRQILFLVPLIILLPKFFGLEGLVFAGPVADGLSFVCAVIMTFVEFVNINKLKEAEMKKLAQS